MSEERHEVRLDFEAIKLPPVTDILVLGSHYQHGKLGIYESLRFLVPDLYSAHDINLQEYPNVGVVFVSKKVLRRISIENIIKVLASNVFPYVDETEAVNVNFTVRKYVTDIEI